MPLPELVGHEELRAVLGRAVREGTLPQSILLHGPAGTGKERIGLWLAQLILCEEPGAEPCGVCRSCRAVLRLEHPDLHWFFPLPRPDASSPEKLRERLEESRAAELQAWREKPFRVPDFDKPPAHYLAAVRTIQQLASVRPASGSHKVFVVGDAELMVPQEASQEAANAFLKLLEEPPASTTLVLTSSQPGALLPTIRSRVLAIRVRALLPEEIQRLLIAGELATERDAEVVARRSRGSLRRAILAASSADAGSARGERRAGRELLIAALTRGALARIAAANAHRPAGARGDLLVELDSLGEWLRDLAAVASEAPDQALDPEAVPLLQRAVERLGITPQQAIQGLTRVNEARDLALGNVNPQLIVADMLAKLQADLLGVEPGDSGSENG